MTHKKIFFLLLTIYSKNIVARRAIDQKETKETVKIYTMPQQHKKNAPLVFSWETNKDPKKLKKEFYTQIKTSLKEMTEKQLRTTANLALGLNWHEDALRYLERLASKTKNLVTAKNLKLEIADINFDRGALKKAAEEYNNFLTLYPGDKHAEYAQYKSILSNYYTIPTESDRDQSATHTTIKLADQFLIKSSTYKHYNQQVTDLRLNCYEKLFNHESTVFDYYLAQNKPKAAETRLCALRKNYSTVLPKKEAETLFMEYRLAQKTNDTERSTHALNLLAQKFPQTEITRTAFAQNNTLNKKDYVVVF